MPTYIIKVADRLWEYSTIVDAITSGPYTESEYREHYRLMHGEYGYRGLDERLERVEQKGTSCRTDKTLEDTICGNRQGPNESEIGFEDFKMFCHLVVAGAVGFAVGEETDDGREDRDKRGDGSR